MPKGDPRDKFFYPTLILMIDSYILKISTIEQNIAFKAVERFDQNQWQLSWHQIFDFAGGNHELMTFVAVIFCLLDLILYIQVNYFSVMSGRVCLDWTSTKQGLMCLAQENNAATPMRLEPATPLSWVSTLPQGHCVTYRIWCLVTHFLYSASITSCWICFICVLHSSLERFSTYLRRMQHSPRS